MTTIDWEVIHQSAIGAMKMAYAPYSKFPVGVAALVNDGRIVTGCNVENASYGVGLCAECGLVSNLCSTGGGRCRQLLFEHGGSEALLMTDDGPQKMSAMLPWAFGPEDLDRNER
jgi:cytidine deaminase